MPFLPFMMKASAVVAGTMLAGTALAYSGGVVEVCVKQKFPHDGPSHIHLPLPALAGPVAMHFAPRHRMHHAPRELEEMLPALRVAAQELEKVPDGTVLVDVVSDREKVHITKSGGDLEIDCDSPRETVHVSFPIRTALAIAEQYQSVRPAN